MRNTIPGQELVSRSHLFLALMITLAKGPWDVRL